MAFVWVLVRRPECGVQLREEQDEVRRKYGDELSAKAMANMPYAMSTVKEVIRILPTAVGVWRYFRWLSNDAH